MILKTLYLKIGDLGLPTEYTYSFLKGSRYICNFIEREVLGRIQFEADGFNRVVISLCSEPKREFFVNSSKIACCDYLFDRERYDSLSENEVSDFYIEIIKKGLTKMQNFGVVPVEEIFQGLKDFQSRGLVNEWTHKEKSFKKQSLVATLRCELTMKNFSLELEVKKEGVIVFTEIILETDPDENAFEYRFKDLKIEGENLVVTSKADEPLFKISLNELE